MKIKLIPKRQDPRNRVYNFEELFINSNDFMYMLSLMDYSDKLTDIIQRAKNECPYLLFDNKIVITKDEALSLLGLDKDKYVIL